MVRRRGIVRGLASQLSYGACRNLIAPQTMPPVARHALIKPAWQWQQHNHQRPSTATPSPLMATMHSLCNKMVGAMPRMPIVPQPEASSQRLSRLRRNLMNFSPESVQVPRPSVTFSYQAPAPVQATPMMPAWCRDGEQRPFGSDISLELKQKLQQLKREQQEEQQLLLDRERLRDQELEQQQKLEREREREQQLRQSMQREVKPIFRPFNFGKCANNMIDFRDEENTGSESSLYTATHPRELPTPNIHCQQQRARLEHHIQASEFGYVQLAKRMAEKQPNVNTHRIRVQPVHFQHKGLPRKAPVSFQTDRNASETTLTNKTEAQAGHAVDVQAQNSHRPWTPRVTPAAKKLSDLTADIDANLQKIRDILMSELRRNSMGSTELHQSLADLQHFAKSNSLKLRAPEKSNEIPVQRSASSDKLAGLGRQQPPIRSEVFNLWQKVKDQQLHLQDRGNSARLNCPATRQQSTMAKKLQARKMEDSSQRQQCNSAPLPDLAALQQTAKSSELERPTKCRKQTTSPMAKIRQEQPSEAESSIKQKLLITSDQLELLQNVLRKDRRQPSETKTAGSQQTETSNRRKINLTQLLQDKHLKGDDSAIPLWNSLMQLVGPMCDDKQHSTHDDPLRLKSGGRTEQQEQQEKKKQRSVYLMLSSDDEDDRKGIGRLEHTKRTPRQKMQLEQMLQHGQNDQKKQQQLTRRKKRISYVPNELETAASFPPPRRRPLHWPKHVPPNLHDSPMPKKLARRSAKRQSSGRMNGRFSPSCTFDRSWWLNDLANTCSPKRGHTRMLNPLLHLPPTSSNYSRLWRR